MVINYCQRLKIDGTELKSTFEQAGGWYHRQQNTLYLPNEADFANRIFSSSRFMPC